MAAVCYGPNMVGEVRLEGYATRRFDDGLELPCIDRSALNKRQIAELVAEGTCDALARVATNPQAVAGWGACYIIGLPDIAKCKIGFSTNPAKRIKALQTALWDQVKCHALFWGPGLVMGGFEQKALHLAKECGVRLAGEWVNLPPSEAIGLVLTAADETSAFTDSKTFCEYWLPPRERLYRAGGKFAIAGRQQSVSDILAERQARDAWPHNTN